MTATKLETGYTRRLATIWAPNHHSKFSIGDPVAVREGEVVVVVWGTSGVGALERWTGEVQGVVIKPRWCKIQMPMMNKQS